MTICEKILAHASAQEKVQAGDLIMADLNLVMGNDITSPVAIKELAKFGKKKVFDKDKIALIPDHFTPNKDIKAAEQALCVRNFAKENNIKNYYECGRVGIEHAFIPENGLVTAGDVVIGADSHTCTYGALGAFSTGVGSTDMAAGMAIGKAWFKVPSSMKFVLEDKFRKYVSGKDLILHIIGKIGVDGALYKCMEFAGDGVKNLSMDDRFTVSNMAIEAGAKAGIFPADEITVEYLKNVGAKSPKIFTSDPDAKYDEVIKIDLSKIEPTVSYPHLPENTHLAKDSHDIKIDQVVIGSCTNGRISDMRKAAEILKGKKISDNVRCIIIPATQKIWLESMHEGLFDTFVNAGCVVSTPTCGPCLGGYMGILAEGEKCVATTNRNFVGRMGHVKSEVYLASPETAAASAIKGCICSAEEL